MVIRIARTFRQNFFLITRSGSLEMVGTDIQTHSQTKGHKKVDQTCLGVNSVKKKSPAHLINYLFLPFTELLGELTKY